MYQFYLESELIRPVINYFIHQGHIVKREIKIGYCRADIVAFKKGVVTAVELKLTDWKKAIIQAKNYQLASDYVYLAFPLMKSYSILRKAEIKLKKDRIGMLIVNEKTGKVYEIIKAKQSNRKMGVLMPDNYLKIRNKDF